MTSKSLFRAFRTPHTQNLAKPSAHARIRACWTQRIGDQGSTRSIEAPQAEQSRRNSSITPPLQENIRKVRLPRMGKRTQQQYELNGPRTQTNPQGLSTKRLNSPSPHFLTSNIQGGMIAFVHGIGDSARSHCIAHHPYKGSSIT